jgi:hypothetical protein
MPGKKSALGEWDKYNSKWIVLAPQTNDCLGLFRFVDWPLENRTQHMAGKFRRVFKNCQNPYKKGKFCINLFFFDRQ